LSTGIKGKAICIYFKIWIIFDGVKKIEFVVFKCRKICLQEFEEKSLSSARSNEILGWQGVGNRQLLYFLQRGLIGAC
jgi:hypothetical protein